MDQDNDGETDEDDDLMDFQLRFECKYNEKC